MIRSWSFDAPAPLECKFHHCFSGFFSPQMGQDCQRGWSCIFPSLVQKPRGSRSWIFLTIPLPWLRPGEIVFPEDKAQLDEHSALGILQNGSSSLPLVRSIRAFLSDIHCEDLGELLEVNLTKVLGSPYDWVPMGFLTLRAVHTESLICQLEFKFAYVSTDSHKDSYMWISVMIKLWCSVSTCLSPQFGGQQYTL